jgi:ribulose-5-phosphate 4-epimerase/fuculose-1-phosphate aldolase
MVGQAPRAGLPLSEVHEDELRRDVALANRIVHAAGLVSAFGHVSARIGTTPRFLIPSRASPALADRATLLVLDTDGNRLEGEGEPNTEFWIHARIYAARPDVAAVAHVHSPSCVALGQTGHAFAILHNSGGIFADGVRLFGRAGLIRSRQLGDEVAATLGKGRAMLLRGHGANLAEPDVRRAAVSAIFLEEAADIQLRALAAVGGHAEALSAYSPEESARLRDQLDAPGPMNRAWEYYVAMAEGRLPTA